MEYFKRKQGIYAGPEWPGQSGSDPSASLPYAQGTPTSNQMVGGLQTGQLADPALGTGITLQSNARMGAYQALQAGLSGEDPENLRAMDATRGAYRGAFNNLDGQQGRMSRGLDRILSKFGSPVLASRGREARANNAASVNQSQLGQLGAIQRGQKSLYGRSLAERMNQFGQGRSVADLLQRQAGQMVQRDQALGGMSDAEKQRRRDLAASLGLTGVALGELGA
jgi:hypothetical protein